MNLRTTAHSVTLRIHHQILDFQVIHTTRVLSPHSPLYLSLVHLYGKLERFLIFKVLIPYKVNVSCLGSLGVGFWSFYPIFYVWTTPQGVTLRIHHRGETDYNRKGIVIYYYKEVYNAIGPLQFKFIYTYTLK